MSAIADAIKDSGQVYFLLELDFEGIIRRYSTRNITVGDYLFEGLMPENPRFGSAFDIRSISYSSNSMSVDIVNRDRLQDLESSTYLNGGTGRLYIWAPGLGWSDIEKNGLLFTGTFAKDSHTRELYSFTLTDFSERRWKTIPETIITTTNWPDVRTTGGGGSSAGKVQPLLFGSWTKGVPLLCVDTDSFYYVAHAGVSKATDAEYNAGTLDVFDKDGGVISAANYAFWPQVWDNQGQTVAVFIFTADQVALEPLTCQIKGLYDGGGDITGTTDLLIEHPADIIHYLMRYHSNLLPSEIHVESVKTMRSLLPGLKFASIVNRQTSTRDVIDRLLRQCLAGRFAFGSGVGVVTFSPSVPSSAHIDTETDAVGKSPVITKTPGDDIVNRVRVKYALNPADGGYESELIQDRTNNTICKRSYQSFGEQPEYSWQMPDVQDQYMVRYLVDRLLWLKAFPHDLVQMEVPYHVGYDLKEGDVASITMPEGSSADGEGWSEEPCILMERSFGASTITQKWWRIGR